MKPELKTYRAELTFRKDRGDELLIRRDVKYFKAESLLEAMRLARAYAPSVVRNSRWTLDKCEEVDG